MTSHDTEHSLHESVTCRRIDQIPSSRQCRYAVRWQSLRCATWNASRGLDDTSLGSRGKGAGSAGSRGGELDAYSDADWRGDKATRRSVSAGVIMRGGHCLKVWTKKQQVVALSSPESELYVAVKTASEGLGIQSVAKDLGISCGLNLHLDASATMCFVNRRGLGKAKHVDMQNLCIQEASKSGRFATKKVDTSVNRADLMTKPIPKARIEQLMSLMGNEFVSAMTSVPKGQAAMTQGY